LKSSRDVSATSHAPSFSMLLTHMTCTRKLLERFGRDSRGVAAVEFACILPVLLLMLVGTLEASRALAVDRRFNLATSMVADLVGRETKLTADDVKAIYNIVGQVMSPFDSAPLKISLIPVMASTSDLSTTKVYAATTNRPSFNGGVQPAKCSAYALPTGLMVKGASGVGGGTVIVVKSSYEYKPALIGYLWGSSTWTEEAIVTPRNNCIAFGDTCDMSCF
jgi:Flp pilus assembly protein TadG